MSGEVSRFEELLPKQSEAAAPEDVTQKLAELVLALDSLPVTPPYFDAYAQLTGSVSRDERPFYEKPIPNPPEGLIAITLPEQGEQ